MKPTDEHLRVLRHMLGIDKPDEREPEEYRNYYAANPGDENMKALSEMGLVEKCHDPDDVFTYEYYRCTPAGKAVARRSHRAIRWTKKKRVYAKFLDVSDAIPDLTFKDFLTKPEFADARESA